MIDVLGPQDIKCPVLKKSDEVLPTAIKMSLIVTPFHTHEGDS